MNRRLSPIHSKHFNRKTFYILSLLILLLVVPPLDMSVDFVDVSGGVVDVFGDVVDVPGDVVDVSFGFI